MISAKLQEALATTGDTGAPESDLRAARDVVEAELPELLRSEAGMVSAGALFAEPVGVALLTWLEANAGRRDVDFAPLLAIAARWPELREPVVAAARARVVAGPMLDALACARRLGDGASLGTAESAEARARLEILIWEAGASAVELPDLGKWLWGDESTFEAMIRGPARGALRGRVLAARCLEISVKGMPATTDPELVGRTLQVLQPLLLHPEPLVWVHAARALGRLTGTLEQMEGTLLDWVLGESRLLRQRAMTAFASLPGERLKFLSSQIVAIVDSRGEDEAWVLAAVAAATPYLFFERRELWDRLAKRVLAGDGGAIAARSLARGLATLWRRGDKHTEVESLLRALREMARRARARRRSTTRRRWIEVTAVTDAIDGAERDPLGSRARPREPDADRRAVRRTKRPTLGPLASRSRSLRRSVRRVASRSAPGALRQRAGAVNALEGCARAFALPPLGAAADDACRRRSDRRAEPRGDVEGDRGGAAEILDLVRERRQEAGSDAASDLPLEVLAIRLGGYALDAWWRRRGSRPGARPDGARHVPLAPQDRGARRRLARATGGAQGGAEHALSGGSSTRRAARRSARSTTSSGSGRSRRGGRSSSIGRRCSSSSRRRCR